MATFPLKSSNKEQRCSANAILSEMSPVYGDKYFTRPAIPRYMFGVKGLIMVEKVLLVRKNLVAMLFRRLMQRSQRSISSCGQTGEWWDKCLHEFGRHVEKWNTNVWRFKTRLLVGLVHFSPLTHNAVQQCVNGYTYPQIFFTIG